MPFSSAPATRPNSDAELLSVIESEIKYAEDCDDHDRVSEPIRPP
jgi:complement component 1 Q subcomponent-binding protein